MRLTNRSSTRSIELKTIKAMVNIYCRHHHNGTDLCEDCSNLVEYAGQRLDKCLFGDDKPTCKDCIVHCYKPVYRNQAKVVMRFAGPRLLFKHPVLAIYHMLKGKKGSPVLSKN